MSIALSLSHSLSSSEYENQHFNEVKTVIMTETLVGILD